MKLPVKIPGYDKWRLAGPPDYDEPEGAEDRAEGEADRGDYLYEKRRDQEADNG